MSGLTLAGLLGFTVATLPAPTVIGVTPPTGSTVGGEPVLVLGTGFVVGATVTIDGNPATNVVVFSANEITCDTPAGTAGAKTVRVTNPDAQYGELPGGFTYNPPASFGSSSPDVGDVLGGRVVTTIDGVGYTGATAVRFGGNAATSVVVVNDTTITCLTPAHAAGDVDVEVDTPSGTVTGTNAYRYVDPTTDATRFYEHPDYTSGTWTARVGTDATEASFPPDNDPTGTPHFIRSNSDKLTNGATMLVLLGANGGDNAGMAVVSVESIVSTDALNVYHREAVWSDTTGEAGLNMWVEGGTAYKAAYHHFSGGSKVATLAVPTPPFDAIIQWKRVSGVLYIRFAGDAWTTGDAVGDINTGSTLLLGVSAALLRYTQLRIKMIAWYTGSASVLDARMDELGDWAAAEHS